MTNVYIKSFNRPFYLDRCIRSVKFNVSGYDRIIVLDDGTLSVYLDRIRQLHPDVEIRSSGADDGKIKLLRQERFDEIAATYPSATEFWVREIAADKNDYCVVIEDDVWVVQRLDLGALAPELAANQAVICKFWWGTTTHHVTAQKACPGNPAIEYFEAAYDKLEDAYSIWIVAFAVFRRDYWLNSVSSARRLGDERSQLIAASEFAIANPNVRFAKSQQRAIHQGWVVPARSTPEYYDKGLIQHLYMDALNDTWLAGQLDPNEGYPYDFPKAKIIDVLSKKLPEPAVRVWDEWHRREVVYFYN
jgi:hypothetical protein